MDIREELTPTILKIKDLAETLRRDRDRRRPADPEGLYHLLNGLADEVEYVLDLCGGTRMPEVIAPLAIDALPFVETREAA